MSNWECPGCGAPFNVGKCGYCGFEKYYNNDAEIVNNFKQEQKRKEEMWALRRFFNYHSTGSLITFFLFSFLTILFIVLIILDIFPGHVGYWSFVFLLIAIESLRCAGYEEGDMMPDLPRHKIDYGLE